MDVPARATEYGVVPKQMEWQDLALPPMEINYPVDWSKFYSVMISMSNIENKWQEWQISFLVVDVPGSNLRQGTVILPFYAGNLRGGVSMKIEAQEQFAKVNVTREDLATGFWSQWKHGQTVPDLSQWAVNGDPQFYRNQALYQLVFVADTIGSNREFDQTYSDPRLRREGMMDSGFNRSTVRVIRVAPGATSVGGFSRKLVKTSETIPMPAVPAAATQPLTFRLPRDPDLPSAFPPP